MSEKTVKTLRLTTELGLPLWLYFCAGVFIAGVAVMVWRS